MYSKEDIHKIRTDIVAGQRERLPKGFFDKNKNQELILMDYINHECHGERSIFLKKRSSDLKKSGLAGLLARHGGSLSQMIPSVLGENYAKPWELSNAPVGFWQGEHGLKNAKDAMSWFVQQHCGGNYDLIYDVSAYDINKAGLGGMIISVYEGSAFKAFSHLMGNEWEPWRYKRMPSNFWTSSEGFKVAKQGIDHMLKSKFGLFSNYSEIRENICTINLKDFKKFHLIRFTKNFGNSHQKLLNIVTKLEIKSWEWTTASQGTWSSSLSCIQAMREWLTENEITDEQIKTMGKPDLPKKIRTLINIGFNGSYSKAIMAIFPLKFRIWEFQKVPQNYWQSIEGKSTARDLVRDMIQNKLQYWSKDDILLVTVKGFKRHNISGVLSKAYSGNLHKAILDAYPGTFQEQDFNKKAKEEAKFISFIINSLPNEKHEVRKRYDWLLSPNGNPMELDIYIPNLNLAFEYQGWQHYINKSDHFSKGYDFEETKKRDTRKREICKENRITLIEIIYEQTLNIKTITSILKKSNREDVIELLEDI